MCRCGRRGAGNGEVGDAVELLEAQLLAVWLSGPRKTAMLRKKQCTLCPKSERLRSVYSKRNVKNIDRSGSIEDTGIKSV